MYERAKLEKLFCPKIWGNEPKIRFFESNEKFGHYFSLNFFYNENIICYILHNSHAWEKSFFWDMGQNAASQSDCKIFKSNISPEQIDELAKFAVACL